MRASAISRRQQAMSERTIVIENIYRLRAHKIMNSHVFSRRANDPQSMSAIIQMAFYTRFQHELQLL